MRARLIALSTATTLLLAGYSLLPARPPANQNQARTPATTLKPPVPSPAARA